MTGHLDEYDPVFKSQYEATGDRKWLACIERFFTTMPGGGVGSESNSPSPRTN